MKLSRLQCRLMALLMSVVAPLMGCGAGFEEPGEQAAGGALRTKEQAISYNGSDYLFVITPKTWAQAQATCAINGYRLVTINDAEEEAFLEVQETYRGLYNWWIGLNDRGIEGFWVWDNGSSVYSNWYPGESTNTEEMDCVVDRFQSEGTYDNRWNGYSCDEPAPFICERTPDLKDNRGSFTYSTADTANATVNTFNYSIYLYAGQLFTVGTCGVPGASGEGDTYLRINNPSGQLFATNDDAGSSCGHLSDISFVVPVSGTYTIRAGCFSNESCSGTVAFTY